MKDYNESGQTTDENDFIPGPGKVVNYVAPKDRPMPGEFDEEGFKQTMSSIERRNKISLGLSLFSMAFGIISLVALLIRHLS